MGSAVRKVVCGMIISCCRFSRVRDINVARSGSGSLSIYPFTVQSDVMPSTVIIGRNMYCIYNNVYVPINDTSI